MTPGINDRYSLNDDEQGSRVLGDEVRGLAGTTAEVDPHRISLGEDVEAGEAAPDGVYRATGRPGSPVRVMRRPSICGDGINLIGYSARQAESPGSPSIGSRTCRKTSEAQPFRQLEHQPPGVAHQTYPDLDELDLRSSQAVRRDPGIRRFISSGERRDGDRPMPSGARSRRGLVCHQRESRQKSLARKGFRSSTAKRGQANGRAFPPQANCFNSYS